MQAPFAILDEIYEAYEQAFNALCTVAKDPGVSVSSVATEVERLLASYPADMRTAVSLALTDALGCLPPKSRLHLSRALEVKAHDAIEPLDRS